jgi:DNA-binding response OmpR family regulator
MSTKKVLLVDDDMTALDLLDIMLERSGFEVVRHTDARWIVEHFAEINPDIVLIDIMMPKMSGDACIEALRNDGWEVPIVAFTAIHESDVHTQIIEKGANLVLPKPCKQEVLVNHLNRLLA